MSEFKIGIALKRLLDRWVIVPACGLLGHEYADSRQYLLPARECSRCGKRQIKLPDIAKTPGWQDAL